MDLIGVKGRIQTRIYNVDEETKKNIVEVIAEKVTFLSSHSKEQEKDC